MLASEARRTASNHNVGVELGAIGLITSADRLSDVLVDTAVGTDIAEQRLLHSHGHTTESEKQLLRHTKLRSVRRLRARSRVAS